MPWHSIARAWALAAKRPSTRACAACGMQPRSRLLRRQNRSTVRITSPAERGTFEMPQWRAMDGSWRRAPANTSDVRRDSSLTPPTCMSREPQPCCWLYGAPSRPTCGVCPFSLRSCALPLAVRFRLSRSVDVTAQVYNFMDMVGPPFTGVQHALQTTCQTSASVIRSSANLLVWTCHVRARHGRPGRARPGYPVLGSTG